MRRDRGPKDPVIKAGGLGSRLSCNSPEVGVSPSHVALPRAERSRGRCIISGTFSEGKAPGNYH